MQTPKMIVGAGLCFALLFFIFSCSQSNEKQAIEVALKDIALNDKFMVDTMADVLTSSAAVEKGSDNTRKFIRTADLKFRVKSVINSTYDIENIAGHHGGFVTYTNLESHIDNTTITAISADSSLETTSFFVTNSIVLRVPNIRLDTVLKEIARNVDYLDYRIIKADDAALSMLINNLTQKRSTKNEDRLTNAIDNRGRKLTEIINAEEFLLNKKEQADNAKIANLSLEDQVNFSTIGISIYQRQAVKRELIPNNKNIDAYEVSLGTKILDALKCGWNILEAVIIFLVTIWWLILLMGVGFFLYRKYRNKSK